VKVPAGGWILNSLASLSGLRTWAQSAPRFCCILQHATARFRQLARIQIRPSPAENWQSRSNCKFLRLELLRPFDSCQIRMQDSRRDGGRSQWGGLEELFIHALQLPHTLARSALIYRCRRLGDSADRFDWLCHAGKAIRSI